MHGKNSLKGRKKNHYLRWNLAKPHSIKLQSEILLIYGIHNAPIRKAAMCAGVYDSTLSSSSMKEKSPKNNKRRSIPSIHFSSQASSGKEPSKKKTPPKNKGTKGCFLLGRLSLKRNKPKKGHIWIKRKITIPCGIPHMVVFSLGDDITPIKMLIKK